MKRSVPGSWYVFNKSPAKAVETKKQNYTTSWQGFAMVMQTNESQRMRD